MKRFVFLSSAVLIFSLAAFIPVSAQWVLETVDNAGDVGKYTSIAIDGSGRPHISYNSWTATDTDLRYAAWNGSWNTETVDNSSEAGQYSSLAMDSNDNPHISYYRGSDFSLRYATKNVSWALQTVEANFNGTYSSIALDDADNPHISYHYLMGKLKYATWNGSWNTEFVDSLVSSGYYTSIALDSTDSPRISYLGVTVGDLKYAVWNGASWDLEVVDSTVALVGLHTSLALDSDDHPHISYFDQTNGDLKYAEWDGINWQSQTVDDVGKVGEYSSLALDASENPHIAYFDYTNGDLKYASWDGATWDFVVVDGAASNLGSNTSLALDASGFPHISYHDIDNSALKYAHWTQIIHDVGVISIDSPPDTICTDSTYTPSATVMNFGTVTEALFKVLCTIDNPPYKDSVDVISLGPGSSVSVNFADWQAPSSELEISNMGVTAIHPEDTTHGNDTEIHIMTSMECFPGVEEGMRPSSNSKVYRLSQNTPNPFDQTTGISFELPTSSYVSVRIYDMTGRVVRALTEAPAGAGVHSLAWDGKNDNATEVPSGIYFYKLTAGSFNAAKKMILIR